MAVFIGVTAVAAAGWIVSLLFWRSATRRHLVLLTALSACLLLPVAWGVRSGTNWTLWAIRSPVSGSAVPVRDAAPPLREPPTEWTLSRREQIENGDSDSHAARTAQSPSGHRQAAVESDKVSSATGPKSARRSMHDASATTITWASAKHWGVVAYTFVAGAMLARLLASLAAVQRVRRRAVEVETLAGGVRVLEANVACPMAVGFGDPAIVLPHGFRGAVRPDQLRDVLAHEAEHLRRGDHWVMLLQGVMAAVYWPVVTVHLLNRALVRAREELCDNAVLEGRDPADYGQTLLAVARLASGRRGGIARLAPSVIRRGELERRVAGLLDSRRDRRTRVSRPASWTVAASLLAMAVMAGTTRVVAVADETPAGRSQPADPQAADPPATGAPEPKDSINWSGLPKADSENATLHRGVVLGPDEKPLSGASVYAASTIELLELADAEKVGVEDLGPVRAVTDAEGRFEFNAQDLSWVTPAGERKRWETLLVATKEGVAPGWLKTWGADRSFRSHWHPSKSREVAVRTRSPAALTGKLLLEGGAPLVGARVRLTGLMAPREYDLDKHISAEETKALSLGSTIDYAESISRPQVMPALKTEATTGEDGKFELPGLPEGFIARIEVTHPQAETTTLRVAVRAIESVYRKPFLPLEEQEPPPPPPKPALYGSGFSAELRNGAVLQGRAVFHVGYDKRPASGVIVARANHNASDGFYGQRFTTDGEGRFEVTGLRNAPQGYDLAFVGSFDAPFASRRERVIPGVEAEVSLTRAVPYRLKLTDPAGKPIDRDVYSIQVQKTPGSRREDVKDRFNDAERVAPGVYEGIVPQGPGAVLVKRGVRTDRPAAVKPKAFFEAGRTDWTREEERHAYGDAWRIARPAVVDGGGATSHTIDQLDLAAVVFTSAQASDGVLELAATAHFDPPVEVTLVDEEGQLVADASVKRQLERYDAADLPETFSLDGLHPQRAEFLAFTHEQHGLIGTLSTTWRSDRVRVVMRPAAILIGRFTDAVGEPNFDFRIRVLGQGVMPDTYVAGRMYRTTDEPGKRTGEFRLLVPPGVEVRGEFVRKAPDWKTRPSAGQAFGPLTPRPGQTVDLGDLAVP